MLAARFSLRRALHATPMAGRFTELARQMMLGTSSPRHLVVVAGPLGQGKTALMDTLASFTSYTPLQLLDAAAEAADTGRQKTLLVLAGCAVAVFFSEAPPGYCGWPESPGYTGCPVCGDEGADPVRHHWHYQKAGHFHKLKLEWSKRVIRIDEQGSRNSLLDVCESCNKASKGPLQAEPDILSTTGRTVFSLCFPGREPFEYVLPAVGPCCTGAPETTAELKYQVLTNPSKWRNAFADGTFDGNRTAIPTEEFNNYELFVDVAGHRPFWSQLQQERRVYAMKGECAPSGGRGGNSLDRMAITRVLYCAGTAVVPLYTSSLLKHALQAKGRAYFRRVADTDDADDADDADTGILGPSPLLEVLEAKVKGASESDGMSRFPSAIWYKCRYEGDTRWVGDKQVVLNALVCDAAAQSINVLLRWQEGNEIPLQSGQQLCKWCGVCLCDNSASLGKFSDQAYRNSLNHLMERHLHSCRFRHASQAREDAAVPATPAAGSSAATPQTTGASAVEMHTLTEGDVLRVSRESRPMFEPVLLQWDLSEGARTFLSKRKRERKSFVDFSDVTTANDKRKVSTYLKGFKNKKATIASLSELTAAQVAKELEGYDTQEALMDGVIGLVRGVDGDAGEPCIMPDYGWLDRDEMQMAWTMSTILKLAPLLEADDKGLLIDNGSVTRFFRNSAVRSDYALSKRLFLGASDYGDDYLGARDGIPVSTKVTILSPFTVDESGTSMKRKQRCRRCQVILPEGTTPNEDVGIYLSDVTQQPYPDRRFCWAEFSYNCLEATPVRLTMRRASSSGAAGTSLDAMMSDSDEADAVSSLLSL